MSDVLEIKKTDVKELMLKLYSIKHELESERDILVDKINLTHELIEKVRTVLDY